MSVLSVFSVVEEKPLSSPSSFTWLLGVPCWLLAVDPFYARIQLVRPTASDTITAEAPRWSRGKKQVFSAFM